jgi:hypothetical protein
LQGELIIERDQKHEFAHPTSELLDIGF